MFSNLEQDDEMIQNEIFGHDHVTFCSEMLHGGYKESGYGKDMSGCALEDYTQIKHVMVNLD